MSRLHIILVAVLMVQILLLVVLRGPLTGARSVSGSQALVGEVDLDETARIRITDGDGQTLEMSRDQSGWQLDGAGGYPVDPEKVKDILSDLEEIEVRRPVVTSGRYHESLRVGDKDFERRLEIWSQDSGNASVELVLGNSPSYGLTYARLAGDDRVYEIAGLATYDLRTEPNAWIANPFVEVAPDRMTGFRLKNAAGEFEIARVEDGWKVVLPARLAGRALDATRVDALLRRSGSIRAKEPVGSVDAESQGFTRPLVTVKFELGAADAALDSTVAAVVPASLEVLIGNQVEGQDGSRFISRSGFAFAATVQTSTIQSLLDQKLSDLLP